MAAFDWSPFPHSAKAYTYAAGGAGITAANRAQAIYANSLERRPGVRALSLRLRRGAIQPADLGGEGARAGLRREDPQGARGGARARGNGLVLLHGRRSVAEAGTLYARAAAMKARDAMEKLDIEAAKAELE